MSTATYQPPASASQLFEAWPETKDLSPEDMKALLNDDEYFDAFFNTLPRVKAYHDAFDAILRANEDITAANMAQKPRLDTLRAETAAAFQAATDLKARWAQLEVEQASEYRRFARDYQLQRLRYSVADQDRLSEGIAADFQSGRLDDDAALAHYREMRRVWHRRALTSELWSKARVKWD